MDVTFIRITPIILAWRFVFVKLHEFIINVQCRVHKNCMCLCLELTLCQALHRLALLHSKQHFSGIQPLDKLEPEKGVPPRLICEPTPRLGYWGAARLKSAFRCSVSQEPQGCDQLEPQWRKRSNVLDGY